MYISSSSTYCESAIKVVLVKLMLSLGVRFAQDWTSGILFIQYCLVSGNENWVSSYLFTSQKLLWLSDYLGPVSFSFFILNFLYTVAPSTKSGCFSGGRGKNLITMLLK